MTHTQAGRTVQDYNSFEQMLSGVRKRAYGMALQLTRNGSDAEDLMQETFVKAWKGFDGYVPGKPFLNWLLRIMQRAYLDIRRRDNPIRKADSLSAIPAADSSEYHEISVADTNPGPDKELLHQELRTELRQALSQLPTVYRQAIVCCDLEGMNYSEIAELQGTTVGTVRSRIHRGRKHLREVILQKGQMFELQP